MLSKTKSISLNGKSTITVDGRNVIAMTMNANVNEDGSVSTSKYLQDKEIYLANKEEVDTDYAEFESYVGSMMEV